MGDLHLRSTVYMRYIKTVYFNFYRNPASRNHCKSICSSDNTKTLWDAPEERKPSLTSGDHFLFVIGLGSKWTMRRTTEMLHYNMGTLKVLVCSWIIRMTDICRNITKINSHDPNVASFPRDNSGFRTDILKHILIVDSNAMCMKLLFIAISTFKEATSHNRN